MVQKSSVFASIYLLASKGKGKCLDTCYSVT